MRIGLATSVGCLLFGWTFAQAAPVAIAIHGGAGTILRSSLSADDEVAIRADLTAAVKAGHYVLETGGSSLDAVSVAVRQLEDSPWFNAGKGAVFNADGVNELDAAIMDGATERAGAVSGVRRIKNPISLARAVMEQSPHVMLSGSGAESFATSLGIKFVSPSYFKTDRRWQELKDARALEAANNGAMPVVYKIGTVGAVALDQQGNLAAATSTGGMTNKRWGRIGDAPIVGAGTYATRDCAVSATGHGEFFIRKVVAHDICARVRYQGVSVPEAAQRVVQVELKEFGGSGGVIAIGRDGALSMPFNTSGMYRASIDTAGRVTVAIYE